MLSNHLILCCPLLLLPLIFPNIRVFTNVSALYIRRSKYWSFSISPSNEYLGLISFRIDWFDLFAVQGTLESSPIPQFESIDFLAFSLPHSPTLTSIHDNWKNHRFDYMDHCQQSDISAFEYAVWACHSSIPRSMRLFISWLKSLSAVNLEPKKIKSVTASTFPPSICCKVMEPDAVVLVFLILSFKQLFTLLFHPHEEAL